jgi:hypothetical protein
VDLTVSVVKLISMQFAHVPPTILERRQIVDQNVSSVLNARKTSHVAIKNVLILVPARVASMHVAKWSITTLFVVVIMALAEIHSFDVW